MVLDKALLLKGAAGFAAVGGVAGLGITAYSSGLFSSKETKRLRDINGRLDALGLSVCHLEAKDLQQDPKIFSKECQLTQEQFKTIKFSNGPDGGEITINNWSNNNQNATLKIEEKSLEDKSLKFTFSTLPSSSISISGQNNKSITVSQNEEYREGNGGLSRVVDQALKTKLEGINEKLKTIGAPSNCNFDVEGGSTTLECSLSETEFKALKFSNKENNGDLKVVDSVPENLKLKVEAKNSVDETSFSFTNVTSDIKVFGDKSKGKIVVKSGKEFKVKEEKLTKVSSNAQNVFAGLNTKLGTLNIPLECRFDEAESDNTVECEATEADLKKIEFSNKGNGEIKIKGLTTNQKVKIKIEKDSQDMKISFPELTSELIILGDKSEGRINIKHDNKFKNENGKLTKETSNTSDVITKLKGYNTQIEKLNLPEECKFDERESATTTLSCQISKDQFKNINFWNRENDQVLTIDNDSSFTVSSIEVKEDKNKLKFNFKGLSAAAKVAGTGNKSFNMRKNGNNDEFEIRSNNKLGQVRKMGENEDVAGLICTYDGEGNSGKCKAKTNNLVRVAAGEQKGNVTVTNCSESCFTFSEYEEGSYNQTIKFTYTGENTSSTSGPNLEKNASYHTENKDSQKYLVKKNPSR